MLTDGTGQDAAALREEIAGVLTGLGLRLSQAKTRMVHMSEGFSFLGFRIQWRRKQGTGKHYVYTFIDGRPVRSVKDKIRALTPLIPCSTTTSHEHHNQGDAPQNPTTRRVQATARDRPGTPGEPRRNRFRSSAISSGHSRSLDRAVRSRIRSRACCMALSEGQRARNSAGFFPCSPSERTIRW